MKENFESQYLKHKLEPQSKEEFPDEESPAKKLPAFIEHSYDKNEGSFEVQLGETKLSLQYSKVGFFGKRKLKDRMSELLIKHKDEANSASFDSIRLLDNLVLNNGKDIIETKNLFPGGNIYFNFKYPFDKIPPFISGDHTAIIITDDPLTPNGIMSILHEVGHYQDDTRSEEESIRSAGVFFSNSNVYPEGSNEKILKDERNAWAFALKNLKPFYKDLGLTNEIIEEEIHDRALKSYSDIIRFAKSATTMEEIMSKFNEVISKL